MYYDFKTPEEQARLDKGEYRTNIPLSRAGSAQPAARGKPPPEESKHPGEDPDAGGVPRDDRPLRFNPSQSKAAGFGQEGDPKAPTFDARPAQPGAPESDGADPSPDVVSVKNARQKRKPRLDKDPKPET